MTCEQCGLEIEKGRRGKPRRFCDDTCRMSFRREAERIGTQAIRRRRKRTAHAPAARAGCTRVPWKTLARQIAGAAMALAGASAERAETLSRS